MGGDGPLAIGSFAGALYDARNNRVVYHESHDEAGNSAGSARTLVVAVAGAALIGETRAYAEARAASRFGLSLFSAGTPMFFMGEEIGRPEAVPLRQLRDAARRHPRGPQGQRCEPISFLQ